ncbi:hypothetical protein EJ110_NYTH10962 [Nymphaea thermarum]|nr:hypothetical protein EJ110_NYTH10962 [Nymphaea thermarum]
MSDIINMLKSDSPTLPTPQRAHLVFSSDSSCFNTSGAISVHVVEQVFTSYSSSVTKRNN